MPLTNNFFMKKFYILILCCMAFLLASTASWAKTHKLSIVFGDSIPLKKGDDPKLEYYHKVTLTKETKEWMKLAEEIDIKDKFELAFDKAGTVEINVTSVEQGTSAATGNKYVAINGELEDGVGWAQILCIEGRLCIMFSDYIDVSVYMIVYNETTKCYTIRITEEEGDED